MNRKTFLQTMIGLPALALASVNLDQWIFTPHKPLTPPGELSPGQRDMLNQFREQHEFWSKFRDRNGNVFGVGFLYPTGRRSGKTTVLSHFVRERQFAVADVAVVVPNGEIGARFFHIFRTHFPEGPLPRILITSPKIHTDAVEVYADEIFRMPQTPLSHLPNFVCGVGNMRGTREEIDKSWMGMRAALEAVPSWSGPLNNIQDIIKMEQS